MSESMIPSTGVPENSQIPAASTPNVPSVPEVIGLAARSAGFKFDGNAIVVVIFITGIMLGAVLVAVLKK